MESGSELHSALLDLDFEMSDLLLVSGLRINTDESPSTAEGSFEPVANTKSVITGDDNMISQLGITVYAGHAPKCERCWRHVPEGLEGRGSRDGWAYRGCACHK